MVKVLGPVGTKLTNDEALRIIEEKLLGGRNVKRVPDAQALDPAYASDRAVAEGTAPRSLPSKVIWDKSFARGLLKTMADYGLVRFSQSYTNGIWLEFGSGDDVERVFQPGSCDPTPNVEVVTPPNWDLSATARAPEVNVTVHDADGNMHMIPRSQVDDFNQRVDRERKRRRKLELLAQRQELEELLADETI
jgi:hypothetical protein